MIAIRSAPLRAAAKSIAYAIETRAHVCGAACAQRTDPDRPCAAAGWAWPSLETLARDAGVSRAAAVRAVRELRRLPPDAVGIEVDSARGSRANRYRVRLPAQGEPVDRLRVSRSPAQGEPGRIPEMDPRDGGPVMGSRADARVAPSAPPTPTDPDPDPELGVDPRAREIARHIQTRCPQILAVTPEPIRYAEGLLVELDATPRLTVTDLCDAMGEAEHDAGPEMSAHQVRGLMRRYVRGVVTRTRRPRAPAAYVQGADATDDDLARMIADATSRPPTPGAT